MKAAAFDYVRPKTAKAAVDLLAEAHRSGRFAKLLAGGQSLGPMLNLRLAEPDLLIDISQAEALTRADSGSEGAWFGAAVTHAQIEDGPEPTGGAMRSVARGISYRAVRNRGTIGGSLAHADPSADWISALAALGAEIEAMGPKGLRRIAVDGLMTGAFATVLAEDEIITRVHVGRLTESARWGFYKINRKTGEFAHAIGAVLVDPDRNIGRAVIGAIEAPPIVISDAAERLFAGRVSDGRLIDHYDETAAAAVVDGSPLVHDPYERRIHLVALRRAVQLASQ